MAIIARDLEGCSNDGEHKYLLSTILFSFSCCYVMIILIELHYCVKPLT